MNRLTLSTLLLALAAPALAQMPGGMQHRHGMDATADGRQPIAVNSMQRERMLAEMRGFLESVHGVLDGAVRNDAAAVAAAATKSGMQMMGRMPGHGGMGGGQSGGMGMGMNLPEDFRALGRATHEAFDQLAAEAGKGQVPADINARLAAITGRCVACHASFRFAAN